MKDSIIQYGPKGSSKDIENILTHIFNINNEISNSKSNLHHYVYGEHMG